MLKPDLHQLIISKIDASYLNKMYDSTSCKFKKIDIIQRADLALLVKALKEKNKTIRLWSANFIILHNQKRFRMQKLLNIDSNAKTVKGQKKGYMTAILYLAPANLSGYQVCPMSTAGCRAACLNTAGRGRFTATQDARIRKTKMFFEEREVFMLQLEREIKAFINKAEKKGFIPTIRLNGTSDIVWYKIGFVGQSGVKYRSIVHRFPEVQFYDYTKRHNHKDIPDNYHLTYSLAEDNQVNANKAIKNGINVAVVFRTPNFPKMYSIVKRGKKYPTIDGDETDLRFLDDKKSIVSLRAKGQAKKDTSGFVKEVL